MRLQATLGGFDGQLVEQSPTSRALLVALDTSLERIMLRRSKVTTCFPMLYAVAHLSFTRFIVDHLKDGCSRSCTGKILRRWNAWWFAVELGIACTLSWLSTRESIAYWPRGFQEILLLLAFWRINEIAIAFYNDSVDRLRRRRPRSNIKPYERIPMLLRSAVGLVVQFAVIYFFAFPNEGFGKPLCDFRDALYFSATVGTSIGQEGQEVTSQILRLAHVYQSGLGILLLVLALSIYVGGTERRNA